MFQTRSYQNNKYCLIIKLFFIKKKKEAIKWFESEKFDDLVLADEYVSKFLFDRSSEINFLNFSFNKFF